MDVVATDLHGHTLYSDGRVTPEEYVCFRAGIDMRVIAVSDHDTFAAVPAAAATAAECDVTLVPAMEVTTFIHFGTSRAEQIHVLAYYPPHMLGEALGRTALGSRAVVANARWKTFVLEWLASLPIEERYFLDPRGELAGLGGTAFPALQSFLDLVMQRNSRVYQRFIAHHVKYWEADRELFGWSPEEAMDLIRGEGGVDIVAHPVRARDKARMERVLEYATGLEVYTSRHKPDVAAAFLDFAERHGKHWTASSDDHQHTGYVRPAQGTPRRTVERLLG
jgi:3',5'-nucleoside bisphosphate phosphatase